MHFDSLSPELLAQLPKGLLACVQRDQDAPESVANNDLSTPESAKKSLKIRSGRGVAVLPEPRRR